MPRRIPVRGRLSYSLPRRVQTALVLHCVESGEQPADVIADAVMLLLDGFTETEIPAEAGIGGGDRSAASQAEDPTPTVCNHTPFGVSAVQPAPPANPAQAAFLGDTP